MLKLKGSALLSALFIMTLVAIAATAMTLRIQLDIYRTNLTLTSDKLYLASQGVIFWAMGELSNSKNTFSKINPQNQVAVFPPTLQNMYPQIKLSGQMYDLQARFNLNNLSNKENYILFENILALKFKNKTQEERLAMHNALMDWISPYSLEKGNDAYVNYYLAQSPPYYASHLPMSSVSELRLLQNINAVDYITLAPYLTVLPDDATAFNINTLPKEMFYALKSNITEDTLEEILITRKEGIDEKKLNELVTKFKIPKNQLTTKSTYFLAVALVIQEELKLINYSILQRKMDRDGKVKVSLISETLNTL